MRGIQGGARHARPQRLVEVLGGAQAPHLASVGRLNGVAVHVLRPCRRGAACYTLVVAVVGAVVRNYARGGLAHPGRLGARRRDRRQAQVGRRVAQCQRPPDVWSHEQGVAERCELRRVSAVLDQRQALIVRQRPQQLRPRFAYKRTHPPDASGSIKQHLNPALVAVRGPRWKVVARLARASADRTVHFGASLPSRQKPSHGTRCQPVGAGYACCWSGVVVATAARAIGDAVATRGRPRRGGRASNRRVQRRWTVVSARAALPYQNFVKDVLAIEIMRERPITHIKFATLFAVRRLAPALKVVP